MHAITCEETREKQVGRETKDKRNRKFVRAVSFFLAFLLVFTQEAPVYAEGLPALFQRVSEQREQKREEDERRQWEESLFRVEEGRTLSGDFLNGMEETEEGPGGFDETDSAGERGGEERESTERQTGPEQSSAEETEGSLRMPEWDPLENPDVLYGAPVQIGRNYKTYLLPDGTYRTIFTAYPNTYMEDGQEKTIDNTLVSGGGTENDTYTNKESGIDAVFPAGESEERTVTVSGNGVEASLSAEDGDYTKAAVSENAIRYNRVYENIDIQYTVQPNGVKQDIILLAPQDKTDFTYSLKKEGIRAVLKNNCVYIYEDAKEVSGNDTGRNPAEGSSLSGNDAGKDDADGKSLSGNDAGEDDADGKSLIGNDAGKSGADKGSISENTLPAIIISAPRMEDAAGEVSEDITLELTERDGEYILTLLADREWIEDASRVYPVKIDPSTTVLQNEIDNFTIANLGGYLPEEICSFTGYFDGIGKSRSYVITTFRYQDILAGFTDVDVISASLNIYQLNENAGFDIGCYRLRQPLSYGNITWENSVNLDRFIAGEDSVRPAGMGWKSYDIRDSVNGWIHSTYESHGLLLLSSDETMAGAIFATENYPDAALTPALSITWQPAGDVPMDYSLDDTTIHLRPMTLTSTDGKMQCYGAFADGLATPYAFVHYALSDDSKNYRGIHITDNAKVYPDSSSFEGAFPQGILRYKDVQSNWQSAVPFTEFDYDTLYSMSAQTAKEDKQGVPVKSDEFLIYRATRYDSLSKIADYYGVPLSSLMFDNKAADTLMVENNTIFIRNPQKNQNTPYQPGELTDDEKSRIDTELLGRGLHCEFGFEPINLNTGNFFLAQEDFSFQDSLGVFAMQRYYNGMNAGRLGSFGRGFTSMFDESISALSDGTLVYNRPDGSSLYFIPDGRGGYKSPEGYQVSLKRMKTGEALGNFSAGEQVYDIYKYEIKEEDSSIHTFDTKGNLLQIKGKNGEVRIFHRDSEGRLTGISREGVTMGITVNDNGCITSITMPDGGVYEYRYDDMQNLAEVKNPMGNSKTFSYDDKHRMNAWYDENGNRVVQNLYDNENRVIRQTDRLGGTITLSYGQGKTLAKDAAGNLTVYEYDGNYRTTRITYPDGTKETKEYKEGRMTGTVDRTGVATSFVYNADGNITKKTRGNVVTSFSYDGNGNLLSTTDAMGNTVTATYDAAGNLIKITEADGTERRFSYDSRNRLKGETDGNGNHTSYSYTGNYLTKITLNGTVTASYAYNMMGQPIKVTDGNGNTTLYTYDSLGRNTSVTSPEGGRTSIVYGKTGLVLSVSGPMGEKRIYTYDKAGNITSVTDGMGSRYEYAYDKNSNRISERDPYGNVRKVSFDAMDRPVKAVDAGGNSWYYEYDGNDRLVKMTNPLGSESVITYDPYTGQALSIRDYEGIETVYSYNRVGALTGISRGGELAEAYEYDEKRQVIKTTYAGGLVQEREYDRNGNCILVRERGGDSASAEEGEYDGDGSSERGEDAGNERITRYIYDDHNRLIKETTPSGAVWEYAYDKAGNLTGIIDPEGGKTVYAYDRNNNRISVTDGEGNKTFYTYDKGNRLTGVETAGGRQNYVYDKAGRIIAFSDEEDYATVYEYDKRGNLTALTDALGNRTVYEWDGAGQLTGITDASGGRTAYIYDACGNLLGAEDAAGAVTAYEYDKNGRCILVINPLLQETVYEYDALDRMIKETDPLGGVRLYDYDISGNLTAFTDEEGNKSLYEYDIYGNLIRETDAKGNKTEYTYDSENRMISAKDADGNTAFIEYDGRGSVLSVTDPLGIKTAYTYDQAGRLVKETASDQGEILYTYDGAGNLIRVTDSLGITTSMEYSKTGNLTGITDGEGNKTVYAYDALGQLVSAVYADESADYFAYDKRGNLLYKKEGDTRLTEYTYDETGRLTAVTDVFGNRTLYDYDKAGNLIKETAPDGSKNVYAYDGAGRMVSETLSDGGSYLYEYDLRGNLTKLTGPTGIEARFSYDENGSLISLADAKGETRYEYDCLNRLTEIVDALGGKTIYTYDGDGNVTSVSYGDEALYQYQYDENGRLAGITLPSGLQTDYAYDTKGQLLKETAYDKNAGNNTDARVSAYTYDKTGNLTGVTDALGGKSVYAYDSMGRLTEFTSPGGMETTFTYDALSNIKTITDGAGNRTSYLYDAKGRLRHEDIAGEESYTYAYDAMDRLISIEGEDSLVSYSYHQNGQLSGVTDSNGNTTSYEYDKAGNLIKTTDPLGNQASYAYDEAGNLSEAKDENGNTTTYDYDALNRLVSKDTKESLSTASYGYDSMGRLTLMDDVTGESLYTYDEAGRVTKAKDGNGREISYEYDAFGNVTEVTYPDDRKVSYTYDALDRMIGVTDLDGKTTVYTYDADGNLTKAKREDGETRITYDASGRVTGLVNTHEGKTISLYGYAYDGRGNIIQEKIRLYDGDSYVEKENRYAYDGMSQLIKSEEKEDGKPFVTTTYLYDPAGNRLKMETVTDGEKLTVNYTYDEAGRLVKLWDSENGETLYTYDKAGNLIKEEGSEERHYLYDACGRLTAVTDKENLLLAALYDGNDNRVFTMEYTPELSAERLLTPRPNEDTEDKGKEDEAGNRTEEGADEEPEDSSYEEWNWGAGNAAENLSGTNPGENGTGSVHGAEKTGSTGLLSEQEIDSTDREKENGLSGDLGEGLLENGEGSSPADGQAEGRENAGLSDAEAVNESDKEGAKAFWYGVLCQAADIFLPAPTPFKTWLHDRMGFRSDVTVLWESRLWEADLGGNVETIEEAGSPFELIEGIFGDENRTAFSVRAYRQVSYVNDITFPNAQVLSEYAVNGIMGESFTGYSYGLWRESFRVTIGNGITGTISAGAASVDGAGIKNTGTVRGSVMTGNYYYTGTGSVANLIWGDGTTGYVYGTNGSRSVYGAESAVLYTRTQAAGYGYNGEYTHEGLGMQYLRARYLNMVTGTFLSRDTYGGAMDNILSQNRYTYVGNNPVNYADPDGHKAVGSTIKNTFSAIADAARNGARNAQNQTGRAAEIATAKAGDGAAAVSMAANRITKNEVHGVSQGTTKGVDAAKTGIVAEASADEINRAAQEKAAHSQAKADFVSMPLDALNSAGAWLDKGFTNLAGYIDASWAGEWVGSAAEWVTQKECAAYNYCINGLQEFLPNSDVERILDGSGLILMGGFKMAGGAFLTFAGALTSYTGIGLGGMAAGTVTGVSGISDIEQGINEIKLGLRNDSTTRTGNYVRDTLYDGNDTIYHLSTGTAAMAGMALRPYVMPKKNPVLAGGKQKDIAKKAAMGEKGGSKTVDIHNPVLDNIRTGSALKGDSLHAFNDIIDNYAGDATRFSLTGGDGVERTLYQIKGSLNGKQGIFEWIVDPDPTKGVTHRRFIEGVGITGKPNARP